MSYTKHLKEAYIQACNIIHSAEEILPETYTEDIEKFNTLCGLIQEEYDSFDTKVDTEQVLLSTVDLEKTDLHVIEFPNGLHLGLDASYLDQVGDIEVYIKLLDDDGVTTEKLYYNSNIEIN